MTTLIMANQISGDLREGIGDVVANRSFLPFPTPGHRQYDMNHVHRLSFDIQTSISTTSLGYEDEDEQRMLKDEGNQVTQLSALNIVYSIACDIVRPCNSA